MFMKYIKTDSNVDLYKCPCCDRVLYAKHTVYDEDVFDCNCKENTIMASLDNGKYVVLVNCNTILSKNMSNCCTRKQSLCDTCRKMLVCHFNTRQGNRNIYRNKCSLYEKIPNPLDEIITKMMEEAETVDVKIVEGLLFPYYKYDNRLYTRDSIAKLHNAIGRRKVNWVRGQNDYTGSLASEEVFQKYIDLYNAFDTATK